MSWTYAASTFDAQHAHQAWPVSQCDAPRHGTSGAPQSPYNRVVTAAPRCSRCAPPSVGRGGGRSGAARLATDRLRDSKEGGCCRPAGPGVPPPRRPARRAARPAAAWRGAMSGAPPPRVSLPGRPACPPPRPARGAPGYCLAGQADNLILSIFSDRITCAPWRLKVRKHVGS